MAAPAFQSYTGHGGNPTTSATVTLPTTAADDVLILVAVNAGATAALTPSGTYNGGAWASVGAGAGTNQWGGVWWSRATGNHSAQTVIVGTATDSCSAAVMRVSGCLTGASPIDTNTSTANLTANGLSLAAFDTTVIDTLVVLAVAADDNIAITSPTKGGVAMDLRGTSASTGGADSIVGLATLAQAAAGTTGAFAGTHASSLSKRLVGFALKPPAAATVERSAAIAAVGDIATVGTFWTEFSRAATIAATGTLATAGEVTHVFSRSSALAATGAIATAPQRDLLRQSALTAAGSLSTASQRDLQRSASLSAVAVISSGAIEELARSASLGANTAIASTGQRDLLRAAALGASALITSIGQIEGQGTTLERFTELAATGVIEVTGQRELHRAAALSAIGLIEATPAAPEWSYGSNAEWTFGPYVTWQYTGGTAFVYTGGTAWTYGE